MSSAALSTAGDRMASEAGSRNGLIARCEDALLATALAAIVLLPLAETALRAVAGTGIPGNAALVQHLTLVASMIGAAVAARDAKLLTLFNVTAGLGVRAQAVALFASHMFAAAVCGFLAVASFELVQTERAAGGTIVHHIPVWAGQAVLPLMFASMTLRLAWQAAGSARMRSVAVATVAAFLASAPLWSAHPGHMFAPALVVLVGCAAAGAPVFAVLGGTALFLFWQQEAPIASVALDHYRLVVNPSLPAIPLFTLPALCSLRAARLAV